MTRTNTKKATIIKGKLLVSALSTSLFFSSIAYAESECSNIEDSAYNKEEIRLCNRLNLVVQAKEAGVDCIDCLFQEQQTQKSNPWVEALGIVAQPLAYLGGMYLGARYSYKSNKVWANAYESGHKECTNRFNSYLDYNVQSGANPILAEDAAGLSATCNGSGMGPYAGYGGLDGNGFGEFGNPM